MRLLIFASGTGTNAEALIHYFRNHKLVQVCGLICNRPRAGVLERAWQLGISAWLIPKGCSRLAAAWKEPLAAFKPDWIALAGWLQLIPEEIVHQFEGRIINLHPALLPKYGGKGMYGLKVHEAVLAAREPFSGISIHYVSSKYDEGPIIYQESILVNPVWTPSELQSAIQQLEHRIYPRVIESLIMNWKNTCTPSEIEA